ncbi:spermatogenesis-associated protein 2 [Enoplosus armatus]|uniref:spermatogenesis-associated protein 2 n=1 Tax=Enoplosus armatus TaxID=215367 RepID=UPI0039937E34
MKDGIRAAEQAEVSRQELYGDYVNWYLQLCTEARPCRDARLLKKAAQYLLGEPEPGGTFAAFPLYQAVSEGPGALSADYRQLLSALIKAAELLETLCVNLVLQPWKKEIKTLKTFTGPFVYCLLPVLSSSAIQSVLACIGYLPHTDSPQSEYRLSEDANPDRAMLVGFELLLARVECGRLLELLEKDQLGPKEWQEVLQKRLGPTKPEEFTEQKTAIGQKEEEEKKKEADRKEVPLYLDTRLAVNPQPKPRCCHPMNVDQSIMEMQRTYPDLAIRGRPLLSDKPHRANSSRSGSKAVHTASADDYSDPAKAADLPKRGAKAAAATVRGSRAGEVFGDDGRSSGCNGSRVDDELSGPQAISLHITLRAGSTAEQSQEPGESQPTAEPPPWTQQQTAAEPPSLDSTDKEQELRELAEMMGQLRVHETNEEVRREENEGGEESADKGEVEEHPASEHPASEHPASEHPASEHPASDPVATEERKQPAADRRSCREGGEDTDDTETAESAQSFVIVDHHKK